jgi:hypothetical protein
MTRRGQLPCCFRGLPTKQGRWWKGRASYCCKSRSSPPIREADTRAGQDVWNRWSPLARQHPQLGPGRLRDVRVTGKNLPGGAASYLNEDDSLWASSAPGPSTVPKLAQALSWTVLRNAFCLASELSDARSALKVSPESLVGFGKFSDVSSLLIPYCRTEQERRQANERCIGNAGQPDQETSRFRRSPSVEPGGPILRRVSVLGL